MVLELPVRAGDPRMGGQGGVDVRAGVRRRRRLASWAQRHRRFVVFAVLAFAVLGFSGAWTGGDLVLEGPGIAMHVRLLLDHMSADHRVPYWLPDLWAGAPVWAVMPTLPLFGLGALGSAIGPDVAVKVGVLGMQITGACGAFVLARSLWNSLPAGLVAGVVFGLQPLLVSHGALDGSPPIVAVMATAPWLAWCLHKGLAGGRMRYVAGAGLLGGFAVLMQVEYALGLAVLAVCLLGVEAGRALTGGSGLTVAQVAGRALVVAAVALGTAAYWLVPFLDLRDAFVRSSVSDLVGAGHPDLRGEPGLFFGRAHELTGALGFSRPGLSQVFFRLGWVGLALTLLSVVLVARRNRDRTFVTILVASALGLWLSRGDVALASGSLAQRGEGLPFAIAGLAAGLLLGALFRSSRPGRWTVLAVVAVTGFLTAAPYLTPLGGSPRLYAMVPLALALGAAYPVVCVQEWAETRRARSAPATLPGALAGAVAIALVGAFLVDVWPSRSYYRLHPPATGGAYREAAAKLAETRDDFRVAPTQIGPSAVANLLEAGRPLTLGWPATVAGDQLWRLAVEPLQTPGAYRDRAYGLAATRYQVVERPTDPGTAAEAVAAIDLGTNPRALPMVRAYAHTVALASRDITPELAAALAYRNVGVFTGSPELSPVLAATTVVDVRSPTPCADDTGARIDPGLASQLGVACGLHTWLDSVVAGVDLINVEPGVGGVFRSTTDRLQGVSVYLDRAPDRAELVLHEVLAGGRSLGPELARGKAIGFDEYGLPAFTFDPIIGSAGNEYAFVLTCPGCGPDRIPRLVAGHAEDRGGNLLVAGTLHPDRAAAFAPIYDAVAADPPAATALEPSRPDPGRWRIKANGAQPALVVVAEAWFPGWTAQVDGRPAPVVEADGGFVGVPVAAGEHVVTLTYRRPGSATTGRLVTAATLLFLVAWWAVRRRRRSSLRIAPAVPVVMSSPPLLEARVRPAPAPRSDQPDWDDVVKPPGDDDPPPPSPSPPPRRPGTARWPPEPF